ncbi:YidC/Oxa1 family membrane protein insertase [Patescibacteria group bacterium]|nr:YidC/Oxa1 family membrane protein insertase [Patescibacteria group bacterium]
MADLFNVVVYEPIYNALAFFVNLIPGGDIGLAIVGVTILVRLALFPISWTAIKTQMTMRKIDPLLKEMREKYKENKEELAKKMMALFKEHKINPFASFFLILIQLPVIIGLYLVLQNESKVVSFDPAILYSFISVPTETTLIFLGLLDLSEKSILLALIVAVTQFVFAKLMMPPVAEKKAGSEPSFSEDLQRSMSLQMQYVFPVLLGIVAYATSASIALYFVVSNTFSIGQELFVRKMHNEKRSDNTNA